MFKKPSFGYREITATPETRTVGDLLSKAGLSHEQLLPLLNRHSVYFAQKYRGRQLLTEAMLHSRARPGDNVYIPDGLIEIPPDQGTFKTPAMSKLPTIATVKDSERGIPSATYNNLVQKNDDRRVAIRTYDPRFNDNQSNEGFMFDLYVSTRNFSKRGANIRLAGHESTLKGKDIENKQLLKEELEAWKDNADAIMFANITMVFEILMMKEVRNSIFGEAPGQDAQKLSAMNFISTLMGMGLELGLRVARWSSLAGNILTLIISIATNYWAQEKSKEDMEKREDRFEVLLREHLNQAAHAMSSIEQDHTTLMTFYTRKLEELKQKDLKYLFKIPFTPEIISKEDCSQIMIKIAKESNSLTETAGKQQRSSQAWLQSFLFSIGLISDIDDLKGAFAGREGVSYVCRPKLFFDNCGFFFFPTHIIAEKTGAYPSRGDKMNLYLLPDAKNATGITKEYFARLNGHRGLFLADDKRSAFALYDLDTMEWVTHTHRWPIYPMPYLVN